MPGGRAPERGAIVVGLVVGCFLTWNVSNVGAAADPLADAYGVSLAVIGLLTTALFVTHLLSQLPAGIWSDRIGPHRVALAACASAAAGNAILLIDDEIALGIVGRLVVGVGSGAGFVAGLDLVRAGRGGPVLQGVYGGATMAGRRSRARGRAAADRRDGLAGDLRGCARARGRRGCPDRTRAWSEARRSPPAAACWATGGCFRSASCRPPRSGLP